MFRYVRRRYQIIWVAGLLLAAVAAAYTFGISDKLKHKLGSRPNIVVVLCDALRADHLQIYGYERALAPNIEAFANESVVYMDAISAAPWTPPSIATMFTGVSPSSHGFNPPNNRDLARRRFMKIASEWETLAENLSSEGYYTAAISASPWISKDFGLDQGFAYHYMKSGLNAEKLNLKVEEFLNGVSSKKQPFFMYLHYMDVHEHPSKNKSIDKAALPITKLRRWNYSEEMLARIAFYDSKLAYFDRHFGELLAMFRNHGLYEHSVILFLADHGEQFRERGKLGHGYNLFDEELHVPLIIKTGAKRGKMFGTVSNMDVFATVLDLGGIAIPRGTASVSLIDPPAYMNRAGVLSEGTRKKKRWSYTSAEGKKIIMEAGKRRNGKAVPQLVGVYDRLTDSGEVMPIEDEILMQELREELFKSIEMAKSNARTAEAGEISPETASNLRTLGYLK